MLATSTTFKSSVNIKFDLENINYLKRYMPTPSHAEAILGVISGFNDHTKSRAHIVIGPYGTGKSMLGTLLASIVSQNIDVTDFKYISNKFASIHDDIHNELIEVRNNKKEYLPVILNGYEGNFKQSLLSAIQKTLIKNKKNIMVPGVVTKIIDSVDNWKESYPKTYKKFKTLLKDRNIDLDIWRLEVLKHDRNEIDWFKTIYPSLTSGADFTVDFGEDFIEQIQFIIDELNKDNIGLFIVYDEFGRYLQNLEYREVNETMQNLQDLAELADHYTHNLHLLFITHKHLRHYFSTFNEEFQNEFQRIEKRFKLYYIESDSSTFLRIAESVISSFDNRKPDKLKADYITNNLRIYPLFNQLNQVEIENLIVNGTYPVHPVTIFVLPYLSALFGQNERTLFTFLESTETHSLIDHIQKNEDYYLPYKLFNYFFPNFFDVDFEEKEKTANLYKKIHNRIPEIHLSNGNEEPLITIVQFITLWELSGLQSKIKLTTEFISFAFDTDQVEVLEKLKTLEELKAIRFNRILGYWEIFEGSSLDIENLIDEQKELTRVSKEKMLLRLEESLSKKYFLSRRYNDEKSMTRYASVNLVFSDDILNEEFNVNNILANRKTDALINVVISNTNSVDNDLLTNTIRKISTEDELYCILPYSLKEIENILIRKEIILKLLNDETIIQLDSNVKKELILYLEDASFAIKKFLNVFFDFSSHLIWIKGNELVDIRNEIVLEELLSQVMYKKFPLTPEVRNDGFNRRKINNVQLKAGYKVVNHLISSPNENNIGIEGNGPEYLIYASIFKNNFLEINNLNQITNKELFELRQALLKVLSQKQSGQFTDLVEVLRNKPFGIRDPLIPILLITLLRDRWDQLLFYNNEMFISQMNGEILYSMVSEPTKYQYYYLKLSDEFNIFLDKLESLFISYMDDENKQMIKPISVTNAMLKWLRHLPRYVQITREVHQNLVDFKDAIRLGEIDPQKGLETLYNIFKDQPKTIGIFVSELEEMYDNLKYQIETELYNIIGVDSFDDLKVWLSKQEPSSYKQNNLVKTLRNNIDKENWLDQITFDLVGVELFNWSDKTREMFLNQIQYEFSNINSTMNNVNSIVIQVSDKVKSIKKTELSTKSKTLHQNVSRILKNGGRNVPKEEIENIILLLLEDFVE